MKLSIIIPCYNEESVLNFLYERISSTLNNLKLEDYEVIFINDGSVDGTAQKIKSITDRNKKYKAIHFTRNFGHQAALLAGLRNSLGEAVFILDADLQDPPELLGKFMEVRDKGFDVIYGIRKKRKENIFKKFCYYAYYRLLKYLSDIDLPLDSGDFCLISRKVVDLLISLEERNKYIRGLRSWAGYKQAGVEYGRDERRAGKPKYSLKKLLKLSYDGIFGFSKIPLKAAFWAGIFLCFACFMLGIIYIILFLIFNFHQSLPGYTSLIIFILFFSGVQLFSLGLIGEYIGRIFDTVNKRPEYIIKERINF